ncbi:hypothetical protein [Thiocapsa marina]|uniref:Glycosyltransferase RgtA/B/C/D-like domain-containing protein n=1 Tax=Thiocapsa marina 5811 TaxID=768671 RepID=F9U985_9GAMM|nr:hypothetical protein [Thiocapsa marina]EGV19343.1 hypothetical protein ThimaDRAFT_1487 [Thiocapsa marina 5811]
MKLLADHLKNSRLQIVILLLIFNACLLVWYIFFGYQSDFHSDSAAKVLLAREIVEMGDYFPDDWNYVNGDLFVLFGHAFIVPLLAFMPAGYTAHAISGLISASLILSGIWFLIGILEVSLSRRLLIVAIIAAGISGFMAENLYGQVSYGAIVYQTCFIIYFSFLFIAVDNRTSRGLLGAVTFVLIVLVFWSNPQRAFAFIGLPLILAILWYRLKIVKSHSGIERRSVWQLCVILFAGAMVATLLHNWALTGANNVLGAGYARWLPYDEMMRNLGFLLKGYLAIFGGMPSPNNAVMSMAGLYDATRLGVALLLLVLIAYQVVVVFRRGQGANVFLGIFSLTACMTVLFLQVTTTIPDMTDPVGASRYLVPSLFFLLVFVLAQPLDWYNKPLVAFGTMSLAAVFVTSAIPSFVKSDNGSNLNWGLSVERKAENLFEGLRIFLADNGLRYGYASYWNAGILSVMSDEEALVRQIIFDRGLPVPMRHLSSNRWYRSSAWQGEAFFLFTKQEADLVDWELLQSYIGKPERELVYGNFRIFVFDRNEPSLLPGWDTRYDSPMTFLATKRSLTRAGRFVEGYDSIGSVLVAEKSEIGPLHFGPYVNVDPGKYRVTFLVSSDYNESGSVRLDVVALPDQKLFAEETFNFSDGTRELSIELDEPRTLEFRVWALGREKVVFRGVTIERVSDHERGLE